MSSDADYAAFLDKANEDSSAAKTSSKQNQSSDNGFKTLKTSDAQIPSTLSGGVKDHTYTSDSDEPFEAVAYKSSGKELNESTFKSLLNHKGEVESLSLKQWDPKGQYTSTVDQVLQAASIDTKDRDDRVKVFRVQHDGSRCEYFVLVLAGETVLGVKARAVE